VAAADLADRARKPLQLGGVWQSLFPEGLLLPVFILLWGMPGTGKSSLALKLSEDWPGRSVFLSFEMGIGNPLGVYLASINIRSTDCCQPTTWNQVLGLLRDYHLVAVDTIQASGTDSGAWRGAVVERMNRNLILTSQVNAQGEVRGGMAAGHDADVSVQQIEYGKAIVRKDRFGHCPREFQWE